MTNLLITAVAAGTATIHAKDRTNGQTVDIACAVSAGGGGGTPAYDTTTFDASTGAGIGGSTGTPVTNVWDVFNATRYPNDAAWRAAIAYYGSSPGTTLAPVYDSTKRGTGGSTVKFNDGSAPDLTDLDNTIQYSGQQTVRCTIKAGVGYPILGINHVPGGIYQAWGWQRQRYDTNFTAVGDDPNSPLDGDASFKITPHMSYPTGRAGLETSSGSGQDAGVTFENAPQGVSGLSGLVATSGARMTPAWSDGAWYDYLVFSEQFTGRNGHVYFGMRAWRRKQGDVTYARWGNRLVKDSGYTGGLIGLGEARFLGQNYNQRRDTDLGHNFWGIAMFNDATSPDPFGVRAQDDALPPTTCTIGNVSSQTSTTATFPLTLGMFARYVRPVVDGVEQTAQEYDLAGEYSDNTTMTPPAITGLSSGSHVFSFNVYNANKTAHVSTGTKTVTI